MGVRIDALPATAIPTLAHEFPAMAGGLTVKLTLEQIRGLILAAGGTFNGDLTVKKIGPIVELWDTAGGANLKRARFVTTGNSTALEVLNDNGTLKATGLTISHTTGVITFAARPVFGTATPWDSINLPSAMQRGRLVGGKLENDPGDLTNDIIFNAAEWRNSTNTVTMIAAAAMSKRLDAAWVAGGGNGGRMSAAAIANGTYHCHAIGNAATGLTDFGFDVSATAPTLPTGYDVFRCLGSINRAAGVIVPFIQDGDKFTLKTPVNVVNTSAANANAILVSMTAAGVGAPFGRRVELDITLNGALAGNAFQMLVTDPATTDTAPSAFVATLRGAQSGAGANGIGDVSARVYCDTSAFVRFRTTAASVGYSVTLFGWIDRRGQDD